MPLPETKVREGIPTKSLPFAEPPDMGTDNGLFLTTGLKKPVSAVCLCGMLGEILWCEVVLSVLPNVGET